MPAVVSGVRRRAAVGEVPITETVPVTGGDGLVSTGSSCFSNWVSSDALACTESAITVRPGLVAPAASAEIRRSWAGLTSSRRTRGDSTPNCRLEGERHTSGTWGFSCRTMPRGCPKHGGARAIHPQAQAKASDDGRVLRRTVVALAWAVSALVTK